MSNPGVLELSRRRLSNGSNFRVEDNLGEAIHLHYDDFRVDLTVNQFLKLCDSVDKSLMELINIPGFDINNFDPAFLDTIFPFLCDLQSCSFERIKLSSLIVQVEDKFGFPTLKPICKSRVIKALNGDTAELQRYKQENDVLESNVERVKKIEKIIYDKGYPFDEKYIILFNDENTIRDGQHRAACLYHLKGSDYEVPIIRMHFTNNSHGTNKFLKLEYIKYKGYGFAKKIVHFLCAQKRRCKEQKKYKGI